VVIQLLNEATKSVPATQVLQVINMRPDVIIHVKHDTFVKLAELKARPHQGEKEIENYENRVL